MAPQALPELLSVQQHMASSLAARSSPAPRADRLKRLSEPARTERLLDAAWQAACRAVDTGCLQFPEQPCLDRLELEEEQGATEAGNAVVILRQGARTREHRQLIEDLVVLACARHFPSAPETETETARRLLWLETYTPLRPLTPLIDHLHDQTSCLGAALARLASEQWGLLAPTSGTATRGEVLVLAAALASLPPEHAARLPSLPEALLADPAAARLLNASGLGGEAASRELDGELGPPPRSSWQTILSAVTLWLFISHGARLLGRALAGYRRPTHVRVSTDGIHIRTRTQLFGRTVRDRTYLLPFEQLASVESETRFARAELTAGLVSLVLGTYVGIGFLMDGLRAPGGSWTLVGWALLFVAAGIALDFASTALGKRRRPLCRLLIRPRQGRRFAVQGLDPEQVQVVLQGLAALTAPPLANQN